MEKRRRKDVQQRLRALRKEYKQIKGYIQEVGFICKGTLVEQHLTCGNPRCRCHQDTKKLHGPYYYLSWKEKGKTVTRLLSPEKASLYREWIDNRRLLAATVDEMQAISGRARKCILVMENQKRTMPKKSRKGGRARKEGT